MSTDPTTETTGSLPAELWRELDRVRGEINRLQASNATLRAEAARWRQEAIKLGHPGSLEA